MRRAFTLIELALVLSIIAVLASLIVPALLEHRIPHVKVGDTVQVKATHVKVVIVEWDAGMFMCRLDGGPDAHPRYTEIHFLSAELEPLTEPEK